MQRAASAGVNWRASRRGVLTGLRPEIEISQRAGAPPREMRYCPDASPAQVHPDQAHWESAPAGRTKGYQEPAGPHSLKVKGNKPDVQVSGHLPVPSYVQHRQDKPTLLLYAVIFRITSNQL